MWWATSILNVKIQQCIFFTCNFRVNCKYLGFILVRITVGQARENRCEEDRKKRESEGKPAIQFEPEES